MENKAPRQGVIIWPEWRRQKSHSPPTNGQQWNVHFIQEGDTGRNLSSFIRRKNHFHGSEKYENIFLCLFVQMKNLKIIHEQ